MNIEQLRSFCLSLKGAEETMPFDETTIVFTVMGKMFCLTDITDLTWINVKCDPDTALELRARYEEVTPGYHMNKKHWNSVRTNGSIPWHQIKEWITDSYNLVVAGLPKKMREELISRSMKTNL